MADDVPEPLLDPLSDLYDAQTNLSTWVTTVKLQRERLRENITKARTRPGRVVPNDEVWSWLLRQGADAPMFILAIDQVYAPLWRPARFGSRGRWRRALAAA